MPLLVLVGRFKVKIKEQDWQKLILVPTFYERIAGLLGVGVVVVIAIIVVPKFIPQPWNIVVVVLLVLFALNGLIGAKVVMDKPTANITIRKGGFFGLIRGKQVISFSSVKSVAVDCFGTGRGDNWWRVLLNTNGKKVELGRTKTERSNILFLPSPHSGGEREYTFNLASKISKFIGREIEDKPDTSDPWLTEKTFDADNLPRDWKL